MLSYLPNRKILNLFEMRALWFLLRKGCTPRNSSCLSKCGGLYIVHCGLYLFFCMDVGVTGARGNGVTGSLIGTGGVSIPNGENIKAFCCEVNRCRVCYCLR